MYLNHFAASVVGGEEVADGYVEMVHGKHYSLQLHNYHDVQCDAEVEMDGKAIGTFRIGPKSRLTLERPPNDQGRFTFYVKGSAEASQAQLNFSDSSTGLIKVTFTPEKKKEARPLRSTGISYAGPCIPDITYDYEPVASASMPITGTTYAHNVAGGTGLSGHSNQNFVSVESINYDLLKQTVIYLRLVGKAGVRPLVTTSTPIPPAVG